MTSDDEFLRRLKSIVNSLELWGNLADAKAVEDAAARIGELELGLKESDCINDDQAARIQELEAELEELRGFYNKYSMIEHRLDRGTHVIVPVEPTEAMKRAALDYTDMPLKCWSAYISAAQPNASD